MNDAATKPAKRTDAFETVFQVALVTLRRIVRSKRIVWALLLVALPLLLSATVMPDAEQRHQVKFYFIAVVAYHATISVPATALVMATSFPWPECDEGTLTYWFTAPVWRWAVHLGRVAAALILGWLILPLGVLAIGGPLDIPWEVKGGLVMAAVTATLLAYPAYLAVFSLVTTWTRRGLIVGVVAIILENGVGAISGNIARLTGIFYVRTLLLKVASGEARWNPELARGGRGHAEAMANTSTAECIAVLVTVAVVGLALTLILVQITEYRGRHGQAE